MKTTIISAACILSSVLLFSTRYMFIAILCTTQNTSAANFHDSLEEHGGPLLTLSVIALLIGLGILLPNLFKKRETTN
ncbi:hypothetical protein [Bacillus sp. Au-Bac7]|uniref:hypothetical protein n=1 Tax=Bacillus sp. Au-Bac7 TaxID=2906458 RepID=UPI001E450638|nr:hypothetical protein [Bacillus sp. Au-Bac7]MCE4049623.1 hypothetical protein [Bacillus sp. Au-Bac7]